VINRIRPSSVCLWHLRQWERLVRVTVECTLFMTHCLRLNLQLHTIRLVRTCRISSFCTVAWQLSRLLLTRRIARSLGDSWASCKSRHAANIRWQWRGIFFIFRSISIYYNLNYATLLVNNKEIYSGWFLSPFVGKTLIMFVAVISSK